MKKLINIIFLILLVGCDAETNKATDEITLQLNWFHDPTFSGEYVLANKPESKLNILEGGVNIAPLNRLRTGQADIAIVGIDIFIQSLAEDLASNGNSDLVMIFVDFQRNPVGWILHPDVAKSLNMPNFSESQKKEKNEWLFKQFLEGKIDPGDKRGTETTSVWIQWKKAHGLPDEISVLPVGFDPSVVLTAPTLAYPVYLNEEPFKLEDEIGEPVVEFDPAVDDIKIYGNVLVTTRSFLETNTVKIFDFQKELSESWQLVKEKPDSAITIVKKVYSGVADEVLSKQITRTTEFVFYNSTDAGKIDVSSNGKLSSTLNALKDAGLVSGSLSLPVLRQYIYGFER